MSYLEEKLASAVELLVKAPGPIKQRLKMVAAELYPRYDSMGDASWAERINSLKAQLGDANFDSTIDKMTENDASSIAARIWSLYNQVIASRSDHNEP